jgi:cytochrome c-type biogenesis protein CcmH/NrfG
MRRLALSLVAILAVGASGEAQGRRLSRLGPAEKAGFYHRWAEEALAEGSVESRLRAVRNLQLAIDLEPGEPRHWLLLGKAKLLGEFEGEARACFRRAAVLDPRSARAFAELGLAWKREWLRRLDTLALARAVEALDTAAALSPYAADPWLELVPLRCERGDLEGAAAAAARAVAGRPRRPEAPLAAACVAYRRGQIERADSLFRAALPRLDPELRDLFQDPRRWTGVPAAGRPWEGLDPDPTTAENELELEYWSRVAHAVLLFHDPLRPGFDFRVETYMRYGRPRRSELNPLGVEAETRSFGAKYKPPLTQYAQRGGSRWIPPAEFPVQVQAWYYPELGMRVVMQDRSLRGRFEPALRSDDDPASRPDPRALAGRPDLLAMGQGLAVFPKLPPPEQRLEVEGVVAGFEGERGPRLLVQVETPATPAESLWARWVVELPGGRAVARGAQALRPAACDPGDRQAVQLTAEAPPGAYRVTVSVRDGRGRRGLFQTEARLAGRGGGLELSDLVLACDDPSLLVAEGTGRFSALVTARAASQRPLVAYLELYRLAAGTDGLARFEVTCEVRRVGARSAPAGPGAALISTSRQEVHHGAVRRQFVAVPVQGLGRGRFRLEVRVRDLVGGETAARSVEFERQ